MTQASGNLTPNKALATFLEKTGYPLIQENSQRKYGPPPDWSGPAPARGSEVFVGKIPRDLFEDELVPTFEKIGDIYEVRLMMGFDGIVNRGYAFVTFTNPEDAKRAIRELDNHEIRKNKCIGVCKSVDNCRLFVGGIPKTKTKEEILDEMKKITDFVSDVILYSSIMDKSKNRGFAFVEYDNHKSAAMARRKLMPGQIQLWGHNIAVDWAEPELEVDEEIMAKVTILYVRNLMLNTSEDLIKSEFSLDNTLKIEKVKKLRDFAFVHYSNRDDAEMALEQLNGTDLDGSAIEVTWAKPVDKATRFRSIRPVSSSTVPTYGPYFYGPILDPYSPMTYSSCATHGPPILPRLPLSRRGRGAAGVRRFRNYIPSPGRPVAYKQVEGPISLPPIPPYSYQYSQNKQNRNQDDGKPFHPAEYGHNMFIPPASAADGLDSNITPPVGANYAPYPTHSRLGPQPFFFAYDENQYYPYLGLPPPSVSLY